MTIPHHPATYSTGVIDKMADLCRRYEVTSVLDPMAGNGQALAAMCAGLEIPWAGVEIEPEWAAARDEIVCADARRLPYPDRSWDAVLTSPAYGNRMGDQYLGNAANEKCRACMGEGKVQKAHDLEVWETCAKCGGSGRAKSNRIGYAVSLGRKVSPEAGTRFSSFSRGYRELHAAIIGEMLRVSARLVVINVSDSLVSPKKGKQVRQYVVQWWIEETLRQGGRFIEAHTVPTKRMKQGANWDARIDGEQMLVFGVEDRQEGRLL